MVMMEAEEDVDEKNGREVGDLKCIVCRCFVDVSAAASRSLLSLR